MGVIKTLTDNLSGGLEDGDIFKYVGSIEKEPEILDLDNPIFVFYIDINGLPRQRAEQEIAQIHNQYRYTNAKIWIVPNHGRTSIECIWKGKEVEKNEKANRTV